MVEVTDLNDKNELVKLPDDFKPSTIFSVEEIKKQIKKSWKIS